MSTKVICNFSEVPANTEFHTRRYQNGVDADSITLYKGLHPTLCTFKNNEWPEEHIPADLRCWYYQQQPSLPVEVVA